MGQCTPSKKGGTLKAYFNHRGHLSNEELEAWEGIRDYSFDSESFKYILEIQDSYVDIDGSFISASRASSLIL